MIAMTMMNSISVKPSWFLGVEEMIRESSE
jgi:hypothetical protein